MRERGLCVRERGVLSEKGEGGRQYMKERGSVKERGTMRERWGSVCERGACEGHV